MANFDFQVEERGEREAMRRFVIEVYRLLYELISEHPSLFVSILLRDLLLLHEANGRNLERVTVWIMDMPQTHLIDHDLSAPSLRAKLRIVLFWYRQLMATIAAHPVDENGQATSVKPAEAGNRTLGAINSVLKSILGAAPGGAALVELKEAVENALNDLPDSPVDERPRIYPI